MDQNKNRKRLVAPESNASERLKGARKTLYLFYGELDRPFLILLIVLLCLGAVMVFSASYAYAQTYFNDSFYFARKQLIWVVLSLLLMLLTIGLARPQILRKMAWPCWFAALVLNALVIVIGRSAGGATRQIVIGSINFQPSELLKLFTVLVCASYMSNHESKMKKFRYGVLPFILMLAPAALLLIMQSHLSATIIETLLIYFMMFIGGSGVGWLTAIGAGGAGLVAYVVLNKEAIAQAPFIQKHLSHVYMRLLVWADPFKYMRDTATNDAGWQPSQSLYAISSGGFWGVGLGNSIEKHGYLPEPQNDYIFAIVCEELGFAGAVAILCIFAAMIIRGLQIARRCNDRFCSLIVTGLIVKLALQVLLNVAVVTNVLPSTGIGLPFFSYGGTALCIQMIEIGIILSFSRYSYLEK